VHEADPRSPALTEKLAYRSIENTDSHLDPLTLGRKRFDRPHHADDRDAIVFVDSHRHRFGVHLAVQLPRFDCSADSRLIAKE